MRWIKARRERRELEAACPQELAARQICEFVAQAAEAAVKLYEGEGSRLSPGDRMEISEGPLQVTVRRQVTEGWSVWWSTAVEVRMGGWASCDGVALAPGARVKLGRRLEQPDEALLAFAEMAGPLRDALAALQARAQAAADDRQERERDAEDRERLQAGLDQARRDHLAGRVLES